MATNRFFPLTDKELLVSSYVGKSLHDVPVPNAILDIAKVKENSRRMLETVRELNISFRAHVKSHKTLELTQYQVGSECQDIRLIGSTVAELEHLTPLLKEYKGKGATVSILYGIPPGVSHISRLAEFVRTVGSNTLILMVDHPAQLDTVKQISTITNTIVKVFLKTDSGYHRAGLPPTAESMQILVQATMKLESENFLQLLGFYSHNSNSYGGSSPLEAMDGLRTEVDACTLAAQHNMSTELLASRQTPIIISCGASPTALSLESLRLSSVDTVTTASADALRASLANARRQNINFEIHAGVYPALDLQQIAASSRSDAHFESGRQPCDAIALSVLSEVCSTYVDRTEHPEALINAGCLALAREPCKSYRGQGVVSPWNMHDGYDAHKAGTRIIVDRVSQEHGILQWDERSRKDELPVKYGQRMQIWPNHACITGAQFDWYLIVDSTSDDENTVRDVWVRWRGW